MVCIRAEAGTSFTSVRGAEQGGGDGCVLDEVELEASRERVGWLAPTQRAANGEGHVEMHLGVLLFSSPASTPRGA